MWRCGGGVLDLLVRVVGVGRRCMRGLAGSVVRLRGRHGSCGDGRRKGSVAIEIKALSSASVRTVITSTHPGTANPAL